MTNAPALLRSLIVYGICLPLAVILGYLLATPLDFTSFGLTTIVLCALAVPVLLRWHHVWLIAAWNSTAMLFLIPGRPPLWMMLAAISLTISVLQYTINRKQSILHAPSIAWPLLALAVVVLATAQLTGGIGIRAFGGETYGGRRYVNILAAIIGYFALISQPIPPKRAGLYVALFFLGAATMAIANLPGVINPAFNFLFLFFPVSSLESFNDPNSVTGPVDALSRVTGLAFMGLAVFCTMLSRYGVRGILDLTKPWRLCAFCFFCLIGLLGGYRSVVIQYALVLAMLFYLEGLHRTRWVIPMVMITLIGAGSLALFASHMPFSIQRSFAFVPFIKLDPVARFSAESSSQWRLEMWREVLPEVPRYLLLGKGYSFNATDQAFARGRGGLGDLEAVEMVGDYHSGPLSVIMPFGIFGVLAFVWFLVAAIRVLHHNYRYGDPAFHLINTFLFAYFVVKVIFFLVVFGSLHSDLLLFLGLVGLSVSLNRGVAKPVTET